MRGHCGGVAKGRGGRAMRGGGVETAHWEDGVVEVVLVLDEEACCGVEIHVAVVVARVQGSEEARGDGEE